MKKSYNWARATLFTICTLSLTSTAFATDSDDGGVGTTFVTRKSGEIFVLAGCDGSSEGHSSLREQADVCVDLSSEDYNSAAVLLRDLTEGFEGRFSQIHLEAVTHIDGWSVEDVILLAECLQPGGELIIPFKADLKVHPYITKDSEGRIEFNQGIVTTFTTTNLSDDDFWSLYGQMRILTGQEHSSETLDRFVGICTTDEAYTSQGRAVNPTLKKNLKEIDETLKATYKDNVQRFLGRVFESVVYDNATNEDGDPCWICSEPKESED